MFEDYCFIGGYDGNTMSNRARLAYETGEKPSSKWTKSTILCAISEYYEGEFPFDFALFSKLTLGEIKRLCLKYSSWHHTSSAFNRTDFYEIDFGELDSLSNEQIREIINSRTPKEKKPIEKPLYVTSLVSFKISVKGRRGWHSEDVSCISRYMSTDKIISTPYGNKRLNCVYVLKTATQKTKFPSETKLK